MPSHLPTPIPLGGAHLMEPPAFLAFGAESRKSHRIDKRDYERRPLTCDIWLIDGHSQSIFRCRVNDVSDAGLHASAPIGFGLGVGQRYELRVSRPEAPRGFTSASAKSLGYGTIIRTEMHVEGMESDRVGFAIRFDVPQLIDV